MLWHDVWHDLCHDLFCFFMNFDTYNHWQYLTVSLVTVDTCREFWPKLYHEQYFCHHHCLSFVMTLSLVIGHDLYSFLCRKPSTLALADHQTGEVGGASSPGFWTHSARWSFLLKGGQRILTWLLDSLCQVIILTKGWAAHPHLASGLTLPGDHSY